MTEGRFPFTEINGFYDALGDSLLRGRFDVPDSVIRFEAYHIDGRAYGYFGPTPAILRIPLHWLFPGMRDHWARPIMLAACFATLFGTYLILQQVRRVARRTVRPWPAGELSQQCMDGLFVLCAAVGTSLFFLMRSPVIYHEASSVAVGFAVWTYACLLHYQERGATWALWATLFCALASFQARGSVGMGAMSAVLLLILAMLMRMRGHVTRALHLPDLAPRTLWLHTIGVATVAGLSVGAILYKNMVVFGNWSGLMPLRFYVQMVRDPARLARTDGNFIQPINLRTNLYNYFHPGHFVFAPTFPFFRVLPWYQVHLFPEARMDMYEEFASLTAVNTFWCVVAALGLVLLAYPALIKRRSLDRLRLILVGALVGSATVFVAACITERYLHDLYPLLIIAGAVGYQGVQELAGRSQRVRRLVPALIALALYTCFTNFSMTLSQPRF